MSKEKYNILQSKKNYPNNIYILKNIFYTITNRNYKISIFKIKRAH